MYKTHKYRFGGKCWCSAKSHMKFKTFRDERTVLQFLDFLKLVIYIF